MNNDPSILQTSTENLPIAKQPWKTPVLMLLGDAKEAEKTFPGPEATGGPNITGPS